MAKGLDSFGRASRTAPETLYIILVSERDRHLYISIDKSGDGSISAVRIDAMSQDVKTIRRIKELANIRPYEGDIPHVWDSAMLDNNSARLNITGDDCVARALAVVINPILGDLTYADFSAFSMDLRDYWDNAKLTQLHQKIARFVQGREGDRSREYLRERDRFVGYDKLKALFGEASIGTARAFSNGSVDRLASVVGRVQRFARQKFSTLSV